MKTNTITKTVEVTISNATLLSLFIDAIYDDAKNATGKDQTLYKALGHLVDISDVCAVKIANGYAEKEERVTIEEFRKWLPTVFAEFARAMLEMNKEVRREH